TSPLGNRPAELPEMDSHESLRAGSEVPPNPYAAPAALPEQLCEPFDPHNIPPRLRLAYLDHERAITRLSWINFGLAVIWVPAAIGTVLMSALMLLRAVGIDPVSYQFPSNMPTGPLFLLLTVFHVGCLVLNIFIGVGLRRLRSWARWADVILVLIFLLSCLACAGDVLVNHKPLAWLLWTSAPGILVFGLAFWTLLSPKSRVLFSGHYSELSGPTSAPTLPCRNEMTEKLE
ncbi:MAG: hypothetical protein ACP5XB_00770, partial [Isosphaeraceae bacterium]